MPTLLEQLREKRSAKADEAQGLIDAAEKRALEAEDKIKRETPEPVKQAELIAQVQRGLTDDEQSTFDALMVEVRDLNDRIKDMEELDAARRAAAEVSRPAHVRSEPLTYTHQKSVQENISYFRDLWMMKQHGDVRAADRLQQHAREVDIELPARQARREQNAEQQIRNAIGWDQPSPFEKRVNPNRTDGQGGYLVPPLWMMDELIPILRAGRVVADQVRKMDLPEGTDSINIPKLSTGTTVAAQTADNAGVSSTDFTDTSVSAGVKTLAGQQDVAIQLIEQSPLSLDEILFTDLIADYNKKLDQQVLAGSNASGQVEGLYSSAGGSPWSNTGSVTYTDASPTVPKFYPVWAQSVSSIAQNRFSISNIKFFVHPRRWYWHVGALDSSNRPLVLPSSFSMFNAIAVNQGVDVAEGWVGDAPTGHPVYVDANITTSDTAGSGSGQDISIALKCDDAFLFEGEMRQRTLPEVLSGTLQVRFQIYNYIGFLLRYGQSLVIGSGTGYAAPSGY
jgi:HK97 family phage major capsid protein